MRPLLASSLIVTCIASVVLPMGAIAAPTRAPLPAQQVEGPTLHPSGNDRLVENGGSGTQGKAASDPDGIYNYGVDQFGGTGGLYTIDQDGNNGCGNDQDFEDDNNGNCGKVRTACPAGTMPTLTLTAPFGKGGRFAIDCKPVLSTPPAIVDSGSGSSPTQSSTSTTTTGPWSLVS